MVIIVSVILLIIFLSTTNNIKKLNLGEEKVNNVLNKIIRSTSI